MAKAPINVAISGDYNDKDIKRAMRDLASLQKDAGGTESGFAKLGKSAIGLGAAFGVGFAGIQGLANVLRDSIAEAQEAIKVNAATAQIIESTGAAANVTADQVADLSQRLSEQIAVDDELIQSSANLILTFKNVANQGTGLAAVFDRTVLAAQDLSAAGFGDAESAAKMLGKALNDPERGLTALSRAGVTFTEQQKEQIKTLTAGGDVLKAQQLILAEVESQVGGVAGATATGIDQFNVYFANLKEEIGLALLPFINALISGAIPAIKSLGDLVRNSSTFFEQNKNAVIAVTVAMASLTAAMLLNRIGGIAFAAQYAAHTVVMASYTLQANAARIATIALTTAMRAMPWALIATAITGFVIALNNGAKAQKEWRDETKRSLDVADGWTDAQGKATTAATAYIATNRFSKFAQKDLTAAISGTVSAAIAGADAMNRLRVNTYDAGVAAESTYRAFIKMAEVAANTTRVTADQAERAATASTRLTTGLSSAGRAASGAGGSVRDLGKEFETTFGERSTELIGATLERLKTGLDEAKTKFSEFASSISGGLFGQLNVGSAVDQAKDSGASIVDTFVNQASGIQAFGDQLQKLLSTNLSEEAFAMVASLSAEKGKLLADELLGANSETLIANFNQAVAATQQVAELVGLNAAAKWYQTGVDSAQKTYEGFRDNFKKDGPGYNALQNVMDRLANSMARETTITVTTINKQINSVIDRFGGARANGGPVLSNTAYLVGERGPELFVPDVGGTIIPNGGAPSGGAAGGGIVLNVNAGMGTNGAEVGRQIVDALKAYERRNGAVYASA